MVSAFGVKSGVGGERCGAGEAGGPVCDIPDASRPSPRLAAAFSERSLPLPRRAAVLLVGEAAFAGRRSLSTTASWYIACFVKWLQLSEMSIVGRVTLDAGVRFPTGWVKVKKQRSEDPRRTKRDHLGV
jgi:hypothetical protein